MKNLILSFLGVSILGSASLGQSKFASNPEGIAIHGYDVVAYHTQHAAIRGSNAHRVDHGGATFYFSSLENKSSFSAAPEKFLPKYGGYCAFAMAMKGSPVPADPQTFKLHNGQLYLFFNDYYEGNPFNTIIPWNGDEVNLIAKADVNWKKM